MQTTLTMCLPVIRKSLFLLVGLLFAAFASSLAFGQESVTAEVALSRLKSGNERFVAGKLMVKDYGHERKELAAGQHPYAVVLACSDSRVAPEIIFDESLGKLFIVRVAGHVADPVVLGSVEYAVEHLHAKLLFVLGHEGCGAVKATLGGGEAPPNITALVKRIAPAVEKTRGWKLGEQDLLSAAIKENVRYQMQMALYESEELTHLVHEKKLKVAGGIYSLRTGRVEMVSTGMVVEAPAEAKPHEPPTAAHAAVAEPRHEAAPREVPAPAHVTPHAPKPAAPPSLAELVKSAYEQRYDVVLQKSSSFRDSHDRCASYDCRNIPAGEKVRVADPLIFEVGGQPRIRVKYKGHLGYIAAERSDLAFVARKN